MTGPRFQPKAAVSTQGQLLFLVLGLLSLSYLALFLFVYFLSQVLWHLGSTKA
jgi:hypothetical protein